MTYDYGCKKCNEIMEVVHGMNENPLIKCPKCKTQMKKRFNVPLGIKGANSGKRQGT